MKPYKYKFAPGDLVRINRENFTHSESIHIYREQGENDNIVGRDAYNFNFDEDAHRVTRHETFIVVAVVITSDDYTKVCISNGSVTGWTWELNLERA